MYVVRHYPIQALDSNRARGLILSSLQKLEKEAHEKFDGTVATWNHKVEFTGNVYYASGDAIVEITTDDKIWDYLDAGTNVRHAKMSKGFQPKTKVHTWGSVAGVGGKESVSWKMNFKGIEAREWSLMAQTEFGKKLEDAIDLAIERSLF